MTENQNIPPNFGEPVETVINGEDEAGSSNLDYELIKQKRDQRAKLFWVILGFSGFFALAWSIMLIHCFMMNHEFIKELLAISRLVILVFTLPILAIITLMWFLMHYIYGPQSAKQTQINGPHSEMLEAINKSLDMIKSFLSCLPFINTK